ncbi:MAG: MMPL family transporter, partial [Nanoarchaeota archaeon]|nr:MMPL family transporter [Nanoarchaeota archaeon]
MNLELIATKIVSFQTKYPKKILWLFLILNLMFIPGIFNLINNVEPSIEKVLPAQIEEIKTMNAMRDDFGADIVYLVVYLDDKVVDVRNPDYLKYIDLLSQKLKTRENIIEIESLSSIGKEFNNGKIPHTIEKSQDLYSIIPYTFEYTNNDYSFSVLKLKTNVGSSAKLIDNLFKEIEEDIESVYEFDPGTRIEITGFPAIDRATFSVIMSDFTKITFVSMIGILIIIFFTFKSLTRGILPMAIVMNALIWTMGIAGYLNFKITVVSMVAAAMIMGLGIDFGIHQVHSYFEKRKKLMPTKSLEETVKELLRAMLGASLTTMAGFLALLFGTLPAMKTLGVILAIGIFTTLIGAVFLLPVLIYLSDRKKLELENKT